MKTLKTVESGQSVRIIKLHGSGAIRRRMLDMGITKGAEVYIRKIAPLGDPVEIKVRGCEVTLRKSDLASVEVGALL